jgi:hypothetical protein
VPASACITVWSGPSTAVGASADPAVEAATVGSLGAAIGPETSTDASEASVEGGVICATVVATAVTTSSLGDVAGWSTAVGADAVSVEEISLGDELLRKRIPVCDCCGCCAKEVCVQPSSPAGVSSVVVVSAGAGAAGEASACVCCDTSGIDGIEGIVPIESSYVGQFGSAFGFGGAGRVVYAFVTTGIWYVAGPCA